MYEEITEFLSHIFCPCSCPGVHTWEIRGGFLSLFLSDISCNDGGILRRTAVTQSL